MSIKPILFNAEMVRAIQDGRKTVTRRVVKPQQLRVLDSQLHKEHPEIPDKRLLEKLCEPPYRPGDVLWVRETWQPNPYGIGWPYLYKASPEQYDHAPDKWRPSIHMPREAARIWLRVTDVRVERLQAPFFEKGSPIFALRAEGVDIGNQCRECIDAYGSPCCIDDESECGVLDDVRDDFACIWDRTLKPADRDRCGWDANPWVWVIEFERCEKPEEGIS